MNINKMTVYETEALNHFTCNYPDDLTFEQILDLIENESDEVTIWEPFVYHPGKDVAELIQNMADDLKRTFEEKK